MAPAPICATTVYLPMSVPTGTAGMRELGGSLARTMTRASSAVDPVFVATTVCSTAETARLHDSQELTCSATRDVISSVAPVEANACSTSRSGQSGMVGTGTRG